MQIETAHTRIHHLTDSLTAVAWKAVHPVLEEARVARRIHLLVEVEVARA